MTTRATMKIAATSGLGQMGPQLSSLDSLSKSLAVSMDLHMKVLDSLSRSLAVSMGPHMKVLDSLSRSLAVSLDSVLTDLQYDVKTVPTYIPARHLGSGPFHEDTEQYDTDSLMVVRKSDLHPEVLRSCGMELSNGDYFHAIEEAIKGLLQRIRDFTGLKADGVSLVEEAFAYKKKIPYIALSKLATSSETNRQEGLIRALCGLIFMYRNPLTHEPRSAWPLDDTEAILVLSQISRYHSWLDSAAFSENCLA